MYQQGWQYGQLGRAAAVAWVMFVLIIGLVLLNTWLARRRRPATEGMNTFPPPLVPGGDLFDNIATAIHQQNIGLALWNSLVVSTVITAATVLYCTLTGFAFGELRFRGRNVLLAITLGTMMIPPSLAVVPLYSIMAGTLMARCRCSWCSCCWDARSSAASWPGRSRADGRNHDQRRNPM
jgi:ABC-type glycerol-3-phosphate transport system permease component